MPNTEKELKICISTGETSGDMHAAKIVKELKDINSNITLKAMGGKHLKDAGAEIVVDINKYGGLNGFNLFDIISKSSIAFYSMLKILIGWKPDVIVLIDYPDFNFLLLRVAKFCGIPVIYFIPPKVWAWRKGRIKTLKKNCDYIGLIFPFEEDYYHEKGVLNSEFIGHPFTEEFKDIKEDLNLKNEFYKKHNIPDNKKIICVMPGSRKSEVKRHLDIVADAISKIKEANKDVHMLVCKAPSISNNQIKDIIKEDVTLIENDNINALRFSDVGILKSGTCNLEAAFLGLPFCVFYKVPDTTAKIIRKFVELKEYSPVNIISSQTVKELIQEEARGELIAEECIKLLDNKDYKENTLNNLKKVVNALNSKNTESPYNNIAKKVIEKSGNKNPVNYFLRLSKYLKPYKKTFSLSLFCMVIFGATDGGIPFLVKYILDGVFANQNATLLWIMPILLILFAIIRGVSELGQQYLLTKVGHNIVKDLRNDTQKTLLELEPSFFINNSVGDLLARFTSDIMLVRELLTNSIAALIRDSIRIIALLVTAFYLDPFLAMIAFFVFPIGIYPIVRFGKRIRALSKHGQEGIGNLSSLVQETILGNKVVRAFSKEEYELNRFKKANEEVTKTFIKSERIRALTGPVNEFLAVIVISAIIMYGGYSVIGGTRSQGEFIAFLLAVFLLYDPFKKLSKLNNQVQMGISGAERLFSLLDQESTIKEPKNPVDFGTSNTIEFRNVSFSYKKKENINTLSNINFKVNQGEKCALVGFSGAGKSTLVDLLPRFIDPNKGEILIGNVNIKNLKLKTLRDNLAIVSQHVFLFNDTVYNNIAYGNLTATKEEVINASKSAYAYDFINKLPNGFDTILGESGLSLSGGERQRIAIARAILKDAPILILDEATAALDNRAEKEVQSAIETLENGRTSIVIAHRLSTVENADQIIVLDEGKIIELGKHKELLGKKEAYYKLHQMQFSV